MTDEKQHTGYLVDVKSKLISLVKVTDFEDILKHLACDIFTIAYTDRDTGDALYVDDIGRLKRKASTDFFIFSDYPEPLAGNGLLLGTSPSGESKDCEIDLLDFAAKISFLEKL